MERVEIATQGELDELQRSGRKAIAAVCSGQFEASGSAHVVASGSAHVVAYGSVHVVAYESASVEAYGSAHVEAYGSAHVVAYGSTHVVAYGSAHVVASESAHVVASGLAHVEAWGSARVEAWGSTHVVAYGSTHVAAYGSAHVEAWGSTHVVAYGSTHVAAYGSAHVVASQLVSVHQFSQQVKVQGGIIILVVPPKTAAEWCDYYGVSVLNGVATVYKALRDDFKSAHGLLYAPGTSPIAPDWDGGQEECGGGLHFSPQPFMGLEFDNKATRFVACPVRLEDIRAPKSGDAYPHKIKASAISGAIVEVDRYGKPIC